MKLIICTDKKGGMLFNKRRVSRDSKIIEKIKSLCGKEKIYMNSYSQSLFDGAENIEVCDDFIDKADENDFCFLENVKISPDKIDELYIFNFNRIYPSDFSFDLNPKEIGLKKIKTENFKGSSHDKITLEIFRR